VEAQAIADAWLLAGFETAFACSSQPPDFRLRAGDAYILIEFGVLIARNRERHSKAHTIAFSGGGEDRNSAGSWDVIAQIWPSSLHSVVPVWLGVDTGSSSLSQLAVLLIMPRVLTCYAPQHVALAGWSLGCGIVQVLAALLATCHGSPSSICMFEGRTRKPFVGYT